MVVAMLAVGWGTDAYATVFYVDPINGSMSNDGSSLHPWKTLEEVFDYALIETRNYPSYQTVNPTAPVKPGDTIRLRTGYHGTLNYQNAHNVDYITIEADTGHTPRLKWLLLGGVSKWIFRGITISPSFDMPLTAGNMVRIINHDAHGPSSDIVIEDCTMFTIDDPSNMTAQERDSLFSSGVRIMGLNNITIRNNTIYNVDDGIVCHGTNLTIEHNTIEAFQVDGINSGGKNIDIRFNTIRNLYEVNVENHCDGIQMFASDGSIVEHVRIEGNQIIQYDRDRTDPWKGNLQGIGCFGGPYGDFHVVNNIVITDMYHGITILDPQYDCSIINNTVVDIIPDNELTPYITVSDRYAEAKNCVIRNNISVFFAYADDPTIIVDHNIVLDNQQQMFVDVENYDVHLRPGAPAIDAGASVMAPNIDYDGIARYRGNAVDAGAYESPYTGDYTEPPTIASVVVSPASGVIGVGDAVTITVTAGGNESGLTPSNAQFNGRSVPLIDQGNGAYVGVYTVLEGDSDGVNVNATGITLTGPEGTSAPASSNGSTICIDAHAPSIASVELIPSEGVVYPGDTITVRVLADDYEDGLQTSTATMLGRQILLTDVGGGFYEGTFVVQENDRIEEYAPDLIFSDSFESGTTSGWNVSTGDIAVSNTAKIASKGLEYTIRSPQAATMHRALGETGTDTYTSFYLRLGPSFSMPENETIYLNFAKGTSGGAWATRLRNRDGVYELNVTLNGHLVDIGSWTTVQLDEWYWVKVHYRSAVNGQAQWWLNGSSRGSYSGDTSAAAFNVIYAYYLGGFDESVNGSIHCDHFQITSSDHTEPSIIEAAGIVLTDAAGNTSVPASSSGSSLSLMHSTTNTPPAIQSVIVSPRDCAVKAGDVITIQVRAAQNEIHLEPSAATMNGRSISLFEAGGGIYTGYYIVAPEDETGTILEATGITLTNPYGTSAAGYSSGSGLIVDNTPPEIVSVTLNPSVGTIGSGGSVVIHVTATDEEEQLVVSNATFNGVELSFMDLGHGTYGAVYEVESVHTEAFNVECIDVVLTDSAGNESVPGFSIGSMLHIAPDEVAVADDMPEPAALKQNYPNPFNATTTIPFTVPSGASRASDRAVITIYNISGQVVRRLVDRTMRPGHQQVLWDGRDEYGSVVSAGSYLVEFRLGSFRSMRRMVFLK